MALNFDADPNRVALKFGTEGLPTREELLLKSLIRILDYRTQHHWIYQPEAADLWLLSEGSQAPQALLRGDKPYKVLYVSASTDTKTGVLLRPLHSDQVEKELNQVGSAIVSSQVAVPSVALVSTLARLESGVASANAQGLSPAAVEAFRLIRWPSIHLLSNSQRIRLATIMLGRPLALAEIVNRSNLTEAYCLDYLSVLKAEGLVVISLVSPAGSLPAKSANPPVQSESVNAKLSLFARIRNRLTLKSPTPE